MSRSALSIRPRPSRANYRPDPRDPELVVEPVRNPVRRDRRDHAGQCGAAGRRRRRFPRGVQGGVGQGRPGRESPSSRRCSPRHRYGETKPLAGVARRNLPGDCMCRCVHSPCRHLADRAGRHRRRPAAAQPAPSPNRQSLGCAGHDGVADRWQVSMPRCCSSAAGFSPGVIDGKEGSLQEGGERLPGGARDEADRQARQRDAPRVAPGQPPSTVMCQAGPDDISGHYVYPFPKEPEEQAKLKLSAIATCSRRSPSAITPRPRRRRAQRAGQADRRRPDAAAAQCHSDQRATMPEAQGDQRACSPSSTSTRASPRATYRRRQDEGVLKVVRQE